MKKGDLKRNSILETAEKLFFEKGYEQTSIQDILDELSLSKGGFYHHFPSKEAILEEICVNRVEARFARLGMELYGNRFSPIEKLNLLLRAVSPFDRDEPKFVAMMLKICYKNRDVRICDHMRNTVTSRLKEMMDGVIAEGVKSGDFFTRHPAHIGDMLLAMAHEADDKACRIMAEDPENPERVIDIAELLSAYHDAMETLLSAPFRSIMLFEPVKLMEDYRAATSELLKLEDKE